jgi:hypothetical protein
MEEEEENDVSGEEMSLNHRRKSVKRKDNSTPVANPLSCTRFFLGSTLILNMVLLVTFFVLLFKLYIQHEHTYSLIKVFVPPKDNNYYWRFTWNTLPQSAQDSHALFPQLIASDQEGQLPDINILTLSMEPFVNPSRRIEYNYFALLTYLENNYEYDYHGFQLLPGSIVNVSYYLSFMDEQSPIYLAILDDAYFEKWKRHELPSYLYTTYNATLNKPDQVTYQVGSLYVNPGRYNFIFYYVNRFSHTTINDGYASFSISIPNYLSVEKKMIKEVCNLNSRDCRVAPHSIVVFDVCGSRGGYTTSVKVRSTQGDLMRLAISMIPLILLIIIDLFIIIGFSVKYIMKSGFRKPSVENEERSNLLDTYN